jgi:hypothetical protein
VNSAAPANGRALPAKAGVQRSPVRQHYAPPPKPRPADESTPTRGSNGMTPQVLIPALLVPLIGYRVYRRFRTSFGRQPVQTKRMIVRIVILSAVATAFLVFALSHLAVIGAGVAGLALGGIVGVVGLRLTRFELGPEGNFYTPNPYIGGTLSAILVARIVYRFLVVMPAVQMTAQHAAASGGNPYAGFQQSPLTLAILMVTIGYYVTYFAGILLKVRASQVAPPT